MRTAHACRRWLRAHWRMVALLVAVAGFTALGRLDGGTRVNAGDCRVFYDSATAGQR